MRHRIYGRQLSRDSEHRRAMLRNLAAGVFEHGEIETTLPKAKAMPFPKPVVLPVTNATRPDREKLIVLYPHEIERALCDSGSSDRPHQAWRDPAS